MIPKWNRSTGAFQHHSENDGVVLKGLIRELMAKFVLWLLLWLLLWLAGLSTAFADQVFRPSALPETPASLMSEDIRKLEERLSAKRDTLKIEGGSFFHDNTNGKSHEFLPVRYEPLENAAGAAVFFECAFVIRSRDSSDTIIKTVGTGLTEATSCGGIISHGVIPIPPDQSRLGVIYNLQGPNSNFRSNILVELNAETKAWLVDEKTLENDYGNSEVDTIWKLREYVKQR